MALKYREREEIVGKRFLCLQSHPNHKKNTKRFKFNENSNCVEDWQWKRGTVRASSDRDLCNTDLNILVEFDGNDWQRREWIRVYEQNVFQLFLIEYTLVWFNKNHSSVDKTILWPSLNFKTLVDKIGFEDNKSKPIELLGNKRLEFVDYNRLKVFQDSELENQKSFIESSDVRKALQKWTDFQDSQRILLTTPSVLVGYRVKVYRSEGTTQWYTAVIVSSNENTRELTLTDDTVLEEHNEDPGLVQMKLIGDGVVESILKGEDIGITPRRRTCNQNQTINSDSNRKTSYHQKRKNKTKKSRKKCWQSSESDIDISEEDSGLQLLTNNNSTVITTPANTCNDDNCNEISNNVNEVKGSQTISSKSNINENLEENNEIKSNTDSVLSSTTSALTTTPNVITSVKCVPKDSNDSTLSTTNTTKNSSEIDLISVIDNHLIESNQTSCAQSGEIAERVGCNASQMVPTMCSVDEQLDTSAPNHTKCESFPTRTHVIACEQRTDENKTSIQQHLNSGAVSSVKVNSDNNNNNNININSIKSENNINSNNSRIEEVNDLKASPTVKSLALDRLESDRPITVYRDPNLLDKQNIRHIESVQHHIRHQSMHSVNTTTASSHNSAPDYGRHSSGASQVRTCQPSILPPSVSSIGAQYKMKSQPIPHSSHPSTHSSHILSAGSHGSHPHSNPVDPQLYHHLIQTHPMVSNLSTQSIDMFWPQKGYSPMPSMPTSAPWNLYNEQIRAQLLHNSDKQQQQQQQGLRIERERREEKQIKLEKESKEYIDNKERIRQEMSGKEKEDKAKEAVEQHFEESLRLARQKKSGWSPISNLPLTKTQPTISRQSQVLPHPQPHHSVQSHMSQQQHQSIKSNLPYNSRDYERERLSKEQETERWMAYVQHQQSTHASHAPHTSRMTAVEAMVKHNKSVEMGRQLGSHQSHHLQSSLMSDPSVKGSHSVHQSRTSPVMEASKHQMISRAKPEPSFSLYGYQPNNQSISYITAAQLKENNRLSISSGVPMAPNMTNRSDMSRVPPPVAHGMDKRESPKIDRSLTPNSRNSTPLGRPPSLSPKTKSPKMMASDRISPLYHRNQTQPLKQYDYSLNTAPPAHQNTSSRSGTPHLSASPISLQFQNQIPVAHISHSSQEQPQNLVKCDSKSKHSFNEIPKTQIDIQRESPNQSLHLKSVPNLSAGYQMNHQMSGMSGLIQQGLVPNPMYKAQPTTQSTTNPSSMPSVISKTHSTKTLSPSISQSQNPHMFPKPGPGIVSGIPICRPNSISYYDQTTRTPLMNPQKYTQNMPQIKSESSNTYPKLPTHSTQSQFNQTQDRNVSVFHRLPSSPHSPRISSVSVPQSPYGPPPGMIAVSGSATQSHTTPPAAHSGVNPYNSANVKRKSIENINPLNKKQRVIENPIQTPNVKTSTDNAVNSNTTDSTDIEVCEPSSRPVPTNSSNIKVEPKDNISETNVSEDFLPKHQKAISVATRASNPSTSTINQQTVEDIPNATASTSSATTTTVSTTSSFHPKLKKAWLQRHSEDKTGVVGTSATCPPISTTSVKSVSESSNSSAESTKEKDNNKGKTNEVIVNGINRKDNKDEDLTGDDDTTSASETELSNSSKGSKKKSQSRGVKTRKRIHSQKDIKDIKKRKSFNDFNKSEENLKIGKENEDKKKSKDKNKDNDKESTDLRSTTTRRGRKPKAIKSEEKEKTSKETSVPSLKKKLQKGKADRTAIAELKKSGAPFLQGDFCFEVAPKLPKCRECRMTPNQRNRKPTIFCRFYDYRKLAFKSNVLTIAGFSQPQDANEEDLKLWLPCEDPPNDLDVETAKFLIAHVGDQFCDLVKQEKEAQLLHMGSSNKNITWKRVVQGVREMCDVCETTLFNIHWVCDKCGFVVCIDCYKARKVGSIKEELCPAKDRDGFQWLLCNNRQQHEPQRLEVTQIIAASALSSVGRMLHTLRGKWSINSNCSCVSVSIKDFNHKKLNGFTKQVLSVVKIDNKQMNGLNDTNNKNWKSINGTVAIIKQETDSTLTGYSSESGNSPLSFFVDVALTSEKLMSKSPALKEENDTKPKKKGIKSEKDSEMTSDGEEDNKHSTLRELLMGPTSKSTKDIKPNGSPISESQTMSNKKANISSELESTDSETKDENCLKIEPQKELQHFTRRYFPLRKDPEPLPIMCRTVDETKKLFPQIPHNWFCSGRLLVLHDPKNSENIHIFQEQWIRGQPVLVKDNHKNLSGQLWHPDSFSKDFGDIKNDLINCLNGDILSKQPMRKFWDGFENLGIRMKDKNGDSMLLKLKDWPPDEEFSELLPTRFKDLMNSLPLPEYTKRNGVLNLAGRLPDCFVRPDLGPKMYSAYGSTQYPDKGTTNLHLDISDAVNVMIFVGIPKESHKTDKDSLQEVINAVDSAGCDEIMKKRIREKGVKVGALWHIYNARDADKIRDLLNKVAVERGETLEPHHDPIHDQSWYLDETLRTRLLKEYGVEGYAIAQCLGDAIFIPAGAPHQVRNLNSCVKVAGDFVSPENVSHCFNLTQEFRQLSDTHTNHEDKLQIKNIIYHAVKDALSVLRNHSNNDSN